ncbi:hypothetical protein [Kitasatospora sp. NPDC057015]
MRHAARYTAVIADKSGRRGDTGTTAPGPYVERLRAPAAERAGR